MTKYRDYFGGYKEYSQIPEQLKALIAAIDADKFQALKLDSKGLSYSQIPATTETAEYVAAIDKFLDIYSDILDMDPRNESEKSKGYKEYAAKILKDNIPAAVISTVEKIVAGDLSGAVRDALQGTLVTALKNTADNAESFVSSSFASLISYFTKQEDKEFFAAMQTVDSSKLAKAILTNEVKETDKHEEDQSIANEVMQETAEQESASTSQVNLPTADLSKSVKLTDESYTKSHN
jgi:hypothetical protein